MFEGALCSNYKGHICRSKDKDQCQIILDWDLMFEGALPLRKGDQEPLQLANLPAQLSKANAIT